MLKKSADLVLQGGVTSALVYIGLIRRLSRSYGFKRLGGASSGAVAAAAAAIAERTRQHSVPDARHTPGFDPFKRLSEFAVELAKTDARGDTRLFNLFQPQPATERGWAILGAGLRHWPGHKAAAAAAVFGMALRQYPLPALLGLLIGTLPTLWFWARAAHPFDGATVGALGVALLAGLLLASVALLVYALVATLRGLRANHFGFCSGLGADATAPPDLARPPLSWAFHGLFNELADIKVAGRPVTFGDLWGAPKDDDKDSREIDLQVITTCLSLRRPYRLPGDPGVNPLQGFFYDPAEWAQFFPLPVMLLLDQAQLPFGGPPVTNAAGVVLRTLPDPRYWPVLMAVRLSLSFPVLLSAVPMYTLDGARDRRQGVGDTCFFARKVYFSDGGVTNNCPVQLFDAALPSHPTFVVSLADLPPGHAGSWRVWLHGDPGDAPPRVRALTGMFSFVDSLIDTLMNWRDSVQRDLPGYRERVATVGLKAAEGGLNLAMPPATILGLVALGGIAARRLQRAFNAPRTDGQLNAWDRHRWVRLRSTLAATQRQLHAIAASKPEPDDVSNAALLVQRPSPEPHLLDGAAVAEAQALLAACEALSGGPDLSVNAPAPAPRLRMSSPW